MNCRSFLLYEKGWDSMEPAAARDLIKFIDNSDIELTDWETDFFESVKNRVETFGNLTEKQSITLLSLYDKAKGKYSTEGFPCG